MNSVLEPLERTIATLASSDQGRSHDAVLVEVVRGLSPAAQALPATTSLADLLTAASQSNVARREVAMAAIRCMGVPNFIVGTQQQQSTPVKRALVDLIQMAAPDLYKLTNADKHKFIPDRFQATIVLHEQLTAPLAALQKLPTSPEEFAARRQEVFRLINSQHTRAYLGVFGFLEVSNSIREAFNSICELLDTKDASFGAKLQSAFEVVDGSIAAAETQVSFVYREYAVPVLQAARAVLTKIAKASSERFVCNLRLRRLSGNALERKYPLHEAGRIVRVKVPMVNDGPGQALDVTAQVVSSESRVLLSGDEVDLGVVSPGEFTVAFDIMVGEPTPRISVLIELSWRTARGPERQTVSLQVTVVGQDPNTDWDALAASDPYSTEVAQGDEFVGRRRKLAALTGRLIKARMQSSYITGQKRVGKTSLALAVSDAVAADTTFSTTAIYLEYGDYARSDANGTVEALGKAIASRLQAHLPDTLRSQELDFRGTLAPLNQIAQLLADLHPAKRFVLILDEFDEIHPEVYRFGPLAEAFFSNLRTLSAKKNVALVLVGGENMPFIIGAQGDQLNKFIREPLNYFSRGEEWDDFQALVRQDGIVPLNWHDLAISRVYNLTNGHPYYAKLICGRVLAHAIEDRDIEVTIDEVDRAAAALVQTLDTNAFAHFWKDGIPAGREEALVVELKRCRLLIAMGRSLRQCGKATVETIAQNRSGSSLATADIAPLLADFCRREIIREQDREYQFALPLFEMWLDARGISSLVADTLGDEMADAIQSAEEQAYVTGPEIATLVAGWQLYRGKAITAEDVRTWLTQVPKFAQQRLLFKMLKNLRFVSELEVREKLRTAFAVVKQHTTAYTPQSRSQRRYDIAVTYVDGEAKSGSRYADLFTEENLLSSSAVLAPAAFASAVEEYERARNITVNGLVIVDDISVTGEGLSKNVSAFVNKHRQFLLDRSITVVVVALLATRAADEKLRGALRKFHGVNIDFRVCEVLSESHFAFGDGARFWEDEDELMRAKQLAGEIGQRVYPKGPLGFGGVGMLLTFSGTCPNNSLPLLHAGGNGWRPLFPRPMN